MAAVVVESTPLAVDHWQQTPGVRLYFLTHMHADHLKGLTPSWNFGSIYCSELSKTLLHDRYGELSGLVTGLTIGEAHLISLDDTGEEKMAVTLLDANHCPGSVMFLFQGYFGNILCTGDFRYHTDLLSHSVLCGLTIDHVYMDNTYCQPNRVLPSQGEAAQMIIDIIRRHPTHYVVVGIDTLGKESLLVTLANELQTMIVVDSERMARLTHLDLPPVFTVEPEEGFIRVVSKQRITQHYLSQCNNTAPTIGILPTAYHPLLADARATDCTRVETGNTPFVVPYSLHSSFPELVLFLQQLKPKRVTPLRSEPHLNPCRWLPELVPPPKKRDVVIPASVVRLMQQKGRPTWYLPVQHSAPPPPPAVREKRKLPPQAPNPRPVRRRPISYVSSQPLSDPQTLTSSTHALTSPTPLELPASLPDCLTDIRPPSVLANPPSQTQLRQEEGVFAQNGTRNSAATHGDGVGQRPGGNPQAKGKRTVPPFVLPTAGRQRPPNGSPGIGGWQDLLRTRHMGTQAFRQPSQTTTAQPPQTRPQHTTAAHASFFTRGASTHTLGQGEKNRQAHTHTAHPSDGEGVGGYTDTQRREQVVGSIWESANTSRENVNISTTEAGKRDGEGSVSNDKMPLGQSQSSSNESQERVNSQPTKPNLGEGEGQENTPPDGVEVGGGDAAGVEREGGRGGWEEKKREKKEKEHIWR